MVPRRGLSSPATTKSIPAPRHRRIVPVQITGETKTGCVAPRTPLGPPAAPREPAPLPVGVLCGGPVCHGIIRRGDWGPDHEGYPAKRKQRGRLPGGYLRSNIFLAKRLGRRLWRVGRLPGPRRAYQRRQKGHSCHTVSEQLPSHACPPSLSVPDIGVDTERSVDAMQFRQRNAPFVS